MKTILTFGVFDVLHRGHARLFERAKALGDYLVVAVQADESVLKYKADTQLINSTEERQYMVGCIRYVDKVITYHDVDQDIQHLDFDVFVKGEDQKHAGFQRATQWCEAHGKQVVTLTRTNGISSTIVRNKNK